MLGVLAGLVLTDSKPRAAKVPAKIWLPTHSDGFLLWSDINSFLRYVDGPMHLVSLHAVGCTDCDVLVMAIRNERRRILQNCVVDQPDTAILLVAHRPHCR